MSKHTPGPWQLDDQADGHYSVWADDERDNGTLIATSYDNHSSVDDCLANARLIAAAPDLLEALLTITKSLDYAQNHSTGFYVVGGIDQARAAIAKATKD